MQPRMDNPAKVLPAAMRAIQDLKNAIDGGGVRQATLDLVHLRASQINGCAPCVHAGTINAARNGESDERMFAVAAWREAPYFTDAERAALALAEHVTLLNDRADPVPDEVWYEATRHYNEVQISALVLWIATTNVFNRLNIPTRQVAGAPW